MTPTPLSPIPAQIPLRPPLKWVGGKRWFIDRHKSPLSLFKNHRIVEPFAGSLALTFGLSPQKALAGDLNPHLINFYQQLQKPGFFVDPIPRTKENYYQIRSEFNQLIAAHKAQGLRPAQLFWLLNRMGFNGLCRFSQEGKVFNTPFGQYASSIQFPHWPDYAQLFKDWAFHAGTYDTLPVDGQDFIFCDPPYDNGWQGYFDSSFSLSQQDQVAQWLKKHPGPGLIMNHATPEILEIYKGAGFECTVVTAPRSVSAKASSRQNVEEVIATHHFSWKEALRSV